MAYLSRITLYPQNRISLRRHALGDDGIVLLMNGKFVIKKTRLVLRNGKCEIIRLSTPTELIGCIVNVAQSVGIFPQKPRKC